MSLVSHEKNVVTRAAYLLFYRRREVFVPCPLTGIPTLETEITQEDAESRSSSESADIEEELTGELTIDDSQQGEDDLPDLEDCEPREGTLASEDSEKAGVMGNIPVPVIELGMDDAELGYTDMDSVD